MRNRIKAIIMSVAAMFVFVATVSAQKVSVAIVDQHYSSETSFYKFTMAALASVYVVYLVLHNKRRKQTSRLYGRS